MKSYLFLGLGLAAMSVVSMGIVACSSSSSQSTETAKDAGKDGTTSPTEAGPGDGSGPTGTILPVVQYAGTTQSWELTAIALGSAGYAGQSMTMAMYTGPGADGGGVAITMPPITDVAPGTYMLAVYLDIGGASPMMPGPNDPAGGGSVTVVAGQTATANITLSVTPPDGGVDAGPPPTDGGADGHD